MRMKIKARPRVEVSGKLLTFAIFASLNAVVTHAQMVTTCSGGEYLVLN